MSDTAGLATLDIAAGIATLTLNRPERLNAFTVPLHTAVRDALDTVDADTSVRALILTGAGRAFCAGQDLRERAGAFESGERIDLGRTLQDNYNPLVRRLASLPVPVIAAVNGPAVGAGAALAITCDIVLAARSATFQFAFAKVALGPDCATSWSLPRLVGLGRALALTLTAQAITAQDAERIGLIWKAVADDALLAEATLLAERFVDGPREALSAIKRQMRAGVEQGLDAALDAERDAQSRLGRLGDYREAVDAFVGRRKPQFSGEA